MAHLLRQSYGKSRVRLSRINRDQPRHEFVELTAAISLDGDFASAFTAADNRLIVATDTMKNTVYLLADQWGVVSIEKFALLLAKHFLENYPHVSQATVSLIEKPWRRLAFAGEEHAHSFVAAGNERCECEAIATREATTLTAGLNGLQVLKTTGSGFAQFHRDQFTSLPETNDRIFATTIEARWPCAELAADWTAARQAIRAAILRVFAANFSPSVQATLFEMAEASFAVCPLIDEITITMPNQHHLPFNMTPFGKTNANITFVPTDEPHGLISGTVRRGEKAQS